MTGANTVMLAGAFLFGVWPHGLAMIAGLILMCVAVRLAR